MNKAIFFAGLFFLFSCSSEKNISSAVPLTNTAPAIIGGAEISADNVISHFVVGLYDTKTHFMCTGSLIRKDLVLTAGHCIESAASNIVVVFALDFTAFDNNDTQVLRTASSVRVHPGYKENNPADLDWDDIALVHFSGTLPEGYAPISFLKDSSVLKRGQTLSLAGYGATGVELEEVKAKKDKKFKQALDAGEVFCNDDEMKDCYRINFLGTDRLRSTETQIEGFTKKEIHTNESRGHGTCVGDSGGPIFLQAEDKSIQLVGLTSRGAEFCDGPAVYTNALEYIDWINQVADELQ